MDEAKAYWEDRHFSFFQNRECEFFPCHKTEDPDSFNCLFCYCPLYALGRRCGGGFKYTANGYKDCTDCLIPHLPQNYGLITGKYTQIMDETNRREMQYRNPAPCVSVLVINEGRILLGLRKDTRIMPGKWCLPCGYIEYGESYFDAAKREVLEETGVEIRPVRIVNVVSNHFRPENGNGVNQESLVIVILAVPASDSSCCCSAGDDLSDVRWVNADGPFPEMAFQGDIHIIRQYQRLGTEFGIAFSDTEDVFWEDTSL